jgi:hypothetical protein
LRSTTILFSPYFEGILGQGFFRDAFGLMRAGSENGVGIFRFSFGERLSGF